MARIVCTSVGVGVDVDAGAGAGAGVGGKVGAVDAAGGVVAADAKTAMKTAIGAAACLLYTSPSPRDRG